MQKHSRAMTGTVKHNRSLWKYHITKKLDFAMATLSASR